MAVIFPDVSEWQHAVNFGALRASGVQAVAVRLHTGYRYDRYAATNLQAARAAGFPVVIWYAYLAAPSDPASVLSRMQSLIGPLQDGEAICVDLEEGAGDQSARALTFLNAAGPHRLLYSGQYFAMQHLARAITAAPLWMAAYKNSRPSSPPHLIWQFTDRRQFKGIAAPCDASVFSGSIDDLRAALGWAQVNPQPTNPQPTDPSQEDVLTGTTPDQLKQIIADVFESKKDELTDDVLRRYGVHVNVPGPNGTTVDKVLPMIFPLLAILGDWVTANPDRAQTLMVQAGLTSPSSNRPNA